jgi:hypothetical protein
MRQRRLVGCPRLKGVSSITVMNSRVDDSSITDVVFLISGFNGLKPVETWAKQLTLNSRCYHARAYSWREVHAIRHDIAALSRGKRVTLVGHSLGGGCAELLSQQISIGTIDNLITVAPYGPKDLDHDLTRKNVGFWLNILSSPGRNGWRDRARNLAAPLFLNWWDQGFISSASENYTSQFPHQDFYKLMTDRCGAAEHGHYRI